MFAPLTKTDIAKTAVQMAVSMKATQIAERSVLRFTSFDTDTITVKVATHLTGSLVGYKLKPFTDKVVDATIARYQSYRTNKKSK